MKKEVDSAIFGALKKNAFLLFSTMAALCLFVTPSVIMAALCAGIFLAVLIMVICVRKDGKPAGKQPLARTKKSIAILLTVLLEYMGLHSFFSTWSSSRKVAALAAVFHLSAQALLLIVGIAGCSVGAYALYRVSAFAVEKAGGILEERLPVQDRKEAVKNIKTNWFFPISAAACFCLYSSLSIGFLLGLAIAVACIFLIASQSASIREYAHRRPVSLKVFSALSAAGICLCGQMIFRNTFGASSKIQALNAALPGLADILVIFGILGAVIGFVFVYVCLLFFWSELKTATGGTDLTDGVGKCEILVYAALFLAAAVFVTVVFSKTQAFYGTESSYDVIYTSDSPALVKGCVWVSLRHGENDLRQPLFAVFAAPFMGFPYLLGVLLPLSASVEAILLDYVQVLMLFAANYMLARAMKLDAIKRICFMIFLCGTYTCPLFLLMMEQYIVAYFWLMLCIYLIAEKKRCPEIALYGAGGTLLTSMALLTIDSGNNPLKDIKGWITGMINRGLGFVALMLAFCRFDVIYNLTTKISSLMGFSGRSVSFAERIFQYTAFIRNCFFAPNAGINVSDTGVASWQQLSVTSVNVTGVVIIFLSAVGFFTNRNKVSSRIAAGWAVFSAAMLLILGWGTAENGLILYSLYFGWAFCVLLFQLIEAAGKKSKTRALVPICSIGVTAAMALYNIPAFMELVNFAVTYYPA